MKLFLFINTFMLINIISYSQNDIILVGNSKSDLQYYYDNNESSKESLKLKSGKYILKIPQNTEAKKLVICLESHNYINHELTIQKLKELQLKQNKDTIRNDVTYMAWESEMCLEDETEFTKLGLSGRWNNDKYKMYIYIDGEFKIEYLENDILYKWRGKSEISGNSTIILKSKWINAVDSDTYQDYSKELQLTIEDNTLYCSELNIKFLKNN